MRPEVCCPLVTREAGGAVDRPDARVDSRVELRPEVCCPLGRPRFDLVFGMASEFDGNSTARTRDQSQQHGSNQRSVAMAAQC